MLDKYHNDQDNQRFHKVNHLINLQNMLLIDRYQLLFLLLSNVNQ